MEVCAYNSVQHTRTLPPPPLLSDCHSYVSLFISSFPLAAFAALVNNVVEIRGDAWILTTQTRRPIPHPARDIGAWKHVLQALGLIAVVTNSGILAFTSNTFEFNFGWNDNFSVSFFVGLLVVWS